MSVDKDQRIAELEAHKAEWRETALTNKRQWMEAIDRAIAAEATLAKVAALPRHMVAAWVVGQREGEERLTSVYAIRADDVDAALAPAGLPATSGGEDTDECVAAGDARPGCIRLRQSLPNLPCPCRSASPVTAPSATDPTNR